MVAGTGMETTTGGEGSGVRPDWLGRDGTHAEAVAANT
jgi:hypothetical protein